MSCTDVQTIQAGNGSKTQFSFDFPYIFKSEIHVYFWNATTKEYDEKLTTDSTYPWRITDANPTIVEFTGTAPPSPATPVDPGEPTVDNVKIRRITKVDDIRALFNPGSAIRSDDLNKNFEQLRYAIQEANCAGIPDDVDEYLKNYYWDRYDNTLYDGDTWVSDDTKIATTAALDARFQDEVNDTFTKAELAAASNIMPDDDVAVPTTGALDNYINEVITNDIGSSDGVTITDDGDGTITVGLADNSVDFDKIKDADQIQLADQIADPDVEGTDNNIFTAKAATRRFNNYYQNDAPTATDGIGEGQVWVDPNDDLTLSVWSGSAWVGITSGGTFTNQPKVVYVDAGSGDDSNDGHRISRPKKTIAAALSDINGDSEGDGSIISVAPGIYAETLPLDIQKNDIGIIGQSLRTCIIHPKIPTADQASYDVDTPHSQELQTMFRINSGSYFANLTLTGLKASGTRGGNSLYTDSTYGLPTNQGWNFAFYPNATIKKSPYIQNVTNFSDSQINNVTFTPHTPGEGAAGDLDSAPTGGGILIDGSVPDTSSPLRSMVCDSYTHTALDGPGIFVTNNGYCQATSSYAFFNHSHITCVNGGQANLAASTSDFGRYGLIADGKSTSAIFTSNVDGAASSGATSFNINEPTAGSGWFGDTQRPATNMLVEVNSVIYPILSATANTDSEGGSGWTVTISRPNSSKRSENLGLNGAVSDDAAVSFYLRSMIASSGHTMEYVGSGTNYTALPENGGVPVEANQKIELNNGKIWTATTDHNGKFTIGGNQTDDPFFEVDQQLGFVTIPEGSIAFNLLSDETPQLGGDLDANGNDIILDTGTAADPSLTFDGDTDTGLYHSAADEVSITTGGTQRVAVDSSGRVLIGPSSSRSVGDAVKLQIEGTDQPTSSLSATRNSANAAGPALSFGKSRGSSVGSNTVVQNNDLLGNINFFGADGTDANTKSASIQAFVDGTPGSNDMPGRLVFSTTADGAASPSERLRIDSSGNVLVGKTTTALTTAGTRISSGFITGSASSSSTNLSANAGAAINLANTDSTDNNFSNIGGYNSNGLVVNQINFVNKSHSSRTGEIGFSTHNGSNLTERLRIDSSGRVGIGTTAPGDYNASGDNLVVSGNGNIGMTLASLDSGSNTIYFADSTTGTGEYIGFVEYIHSSNSMRFATNAAEAMRIDSSGTVKIGTGTGNPILILNASTSGTSVIQMGDSADNNIGQIQYANSDDSMRFFANNSERLRIDSSGNVGIGDSSPSDKLSVSGGNVGIYNTGSSHGNLYFYKDGTAKAWVKYRGDNERLIIGNTSDALTIDSSGRLLISTTSSTSNIAGYGNGGIQLNSTTTAQACVNLIHRNNSNNTHAVVLAKARDGAANGGRVQNNDDFGAISFQGFDGTGGNSYRRGAEIRGAVDGTPGNNDMPGRLEFLTTPDGSATPTERMRIDSSGRLLVGSTSAETSFRTPKVQIKGSDNNTGLLIHNTNSTADGASIIFAHSRGTGTVNSGDLLGDLVWCANDGTDIQTRAAYIRAAVDGTPGSNDMPGRIQFYTTADGSSSPTERMRITSAGAFKSSTDGTYQNVSSTSHEFCQSNASVYALRIEHSGTTPSGILIDYSAVTQNDTGSSFIQGEDATTFRFRFASNGGLYNYSGNDSNLCDEREKKNIETLDSTWGCLKNWELKKFHYNEDADTDDKRYGVIAQQVEQHCPEVISDWIKQSAAEAVLDDDGNVVTPAREEILRKGVKEQQMMWMAIKALQEAQDRIETLEAKVAALEAE